jgi:hypothetical protein
MTSDKERKLTPISLRPIAGPDKKLDIMCAL